MNILKQLFLLFTGQLEELDIELKDNENLCDLR